MAIDLEHSSDEQDKLGIRSASNVVNHCSISGVNSQENNLYSLTANTSDDNIIEDNVTEGVVNFEPQKGLKFETKEAAYSFYRDYARCIGFSITIKASRRSKKSGKFIDVKIACSRFGSKRNGSRTFSAHSQPCPKTDCKANMHMKRMQDGKWIINSFVKEHNHEIHEDYYNALRGKNKLSFIAPCQKKGLQLALAEGDMELMFEHFNQMQDIPNFFYAVDLNSEKRLKNVLWVDAKGKHDYRYFYDVVFIDIHYVKNKYKLPVVPIFGVNNHLQLIFLGCALIGDYTLSTLVWLLRTWKKAMDGQSPIVIITDEDKSLTEAIEQIFPDSRHFFSLWDVLEKIPRNLGFMGDEYEHFLAKFKKCIYRSFTIENFEKRWYKLVEKFELRENKFMKSLYEDRKKWVPNIMKNTFLAGISTTKRSESVISFFDRYLSKETTLKEFFEKYKAFLHERYESEAKNDFEIQPALRSLSSYEKQLSNIYTYEVFNKFQVEVMGAVNCHIEKESDDDVAVIYQVDDSEQRQKFTVSLNKVELEICCLCRLFEYNGILCRHALLVLQVTGIPNIPSRYVLKRLSKDANRKVIVSELPKGTHCKLQRFDELCKRAIRLGEEGSASRESYNIAFQALEEALKKCASMNKSVKSSLGHKTLTIRDFISIEENCPSKASKKKKTCKKRKVHLEPETLSLGPQDSFPQMEAPNSTGHVLDYCYVPQQDMQEMEGGSGPTLDSYYGAPQSMQGLVQLNLRSPLDHDYFSNQQGTINGGEIHTTF